MAAASGFIVVGGKKFTIDTTYKASSHVVDEGTELQRQADYDRQQDEERARYLAYCQTLHEQHIEQLRQEDDEQRERRLEQRKRGRYGDDYVESAADAEDEEANEELLKKCRNAASELAQGKTQEVFLPPSEFGKDAEWYCERESTVEKEKDYVPVMYQPRRDIESLLDFDEDPQPKSCFGCEYLRNPGANQIYAESWEKVVRTWKAGLSVHLNYAAFGRELHTVFNEAVLPILIKQGRAKPGAEVWSPYGILYHFMEHCDDQLTRLMLLVRGVDDGIGTVINNELFIRHPTSGRLKTSKEGWKNLKTAAETRRILSVPLMAAMAASSPSSTTAGKSGASAATDLLSAAKRQLYTTRELVGRPNYTGQHSRYN